MLLQAKLITSSFLKLTMFLRIHFISIIFTILDTVKL